MTANNIDLFGLSLHACPHILDGEAAMADDALGNRAQTGFLSTRYTKLLGPAIRAQILALDVYLVSTASVLCSVSSRFTLPFGMCNPGSESRGWLRYIHWHP